MKQERGSALVTVILVVLVLTMVGLGGMLFMGVEDRISGSDLLQKEALYAAEAGLREGEPIIGSMGPSDFTNLLSHVPQTPCNATAPQLPEPPGTYGGYNIAHLGTYLTDGTGTEIVNREIYGGYEDSGGTLLRASPFKAFYSVYVRNNQEDGNPLINTDEHIDLISVGWIQNDAGDVLAVKIVAERMSAGLPEDVNPQKGGNAGSTNTTRI